MELPTCPRCQPAVGRLIEDERLDVATAEGPTRGDCVCEGKGATGASLRVRFALRLSGTRGLLVVGFQENFRPALADIQCAHVRHIGNAGDAKAIASQVELAILVPGSKMGHSESEPYMKALGAHAVRVITTNGNQLSDVIRVLVEDAVERRPALRRAP